MPYKPIGHGKYKSASGKVINKRQLMLWWAHGGKWPGEKGKGEARKK